MEILRICRLCQSTDNLQMIFQEGNQEILCMLRSIASSPIEMNDHHPQHICFQCMNSLKETAHFISLYKSNYIKNMKKTCLQEEKAKVIAEVKNIEIKDAERADAMMSLDEHLQVPKTQQLHSSEKCSESCNSMNNLIIEISPPSPIDYLDKSLDSSSHIYVCSKCNKSFIRLTSYQYHMIYHDNPDLYKCKKCGLTFEGPTILKIHEKSHLKKVLHKCKICGGSFNQLEDIRQHMLLHRNVYNCNECGHMFESLKRLTMHKSHHLVQKRYTCNDCGETFKLPSILRRHRKSHSKPNIIKRGDESDQRHLKTLYVKKALHLVPNIYKCDVCRKSFRELKNFKRHKKLHSNSGLYKCNICAKTFSAFWNFGAHERLHSNSNLQI